MRALLVVLAGVALLVGVATQPASAGKGTEYDRFLKQIEKCADGDIYSQKPKGLCVCQDGGSYHTLVGALLYSEESDDSGVKVICYVREFNSDGRLASAHPCETFEVLSK
jgi:hypothetical protein